MCKTHKEGESAKGMKQKCPTCEGRKIVEGTCVCDAEWRGTQAGSEWKDCQCTPEESCPTCKGTGVVSAG